jgi:hypothetical protein
MADAAWTHGDGVVKGTPSHLVCNCNMAGGSTLPPLPCPIHGPWNPYWMRPTWPTFTWTVSAITNTAPHEPVEATRPEDV